jgi:NitT/TauT family transport system substrate-binding protein
MENEMKQAAKRLVGVVAVITALGGMSSVSAKELTKVTVMQPIASYDVRYAPWAVAKENGYLAEEGLDVEMPLSKGSVVVIQQMVNGSAVYAQLPPDGVIIANSKGASLKFFYSFITKNPFPLAVLESSSIKNLDDLRGKKIGVFSLSAVQFYTTQAIMKSKGMVKDKDYQLIDVGSGASALAALQRGDVDALAQDVLIYAGFNNRGAKFRYMSSPQIESVFAWGLVSTEDNLKKNPEQAAALARALTKGRIACAANTKKCIEDYFKVYPNAKPAGIPTDTAIAEQERILKIYLSYGQKPASGQWGSYSTESWNAAMQYMVDSELIASPVALSRMYTSDLLPKINQFDEAAIVNAVK